MHYNVYLDLLCFESGSEINVIFLLQLCEDKWLTDSPVLFLAEVPWAQLMLAVCSTVSAGLLCDSKIFAPPSTNLYKPILNPIPFIFTIWKEQYTPPFSWLYLSFPLELNSTDASAFLKINRPCAWCVLLALRLRYACHYLSPFCA